jgi:monovalent cation:H+ antiporter-2, CPA2 family
VLVIALGIAVLSAELFGVSMALGAFLAGMIVGQSEFSYRAASEALPMRDAFAVLFFVSVGMLFNPERLLASPMLTLVTMAIVMLGKPAAAFLITQAFGYGAQVSLRVAVSLAQIGEFSFILAVLAGPLKILPAGATDSIVAASIASITLNPLIYRAIPAMEKRIRRGRPRTDHADGAQTGEPSPTRGAVVVGYGPVGEGVCKLLRERNIQPTVIELNIGTVRRLHHAGIVAVYGDAAQPEVLEEAGIRSAAALIITAPGSPEFSEVIRAAKTLNPGIHVLARSEYLKHTEVLLGAGADLVYSGEAEVAAAMIEATLLRLGATPEQAFAERERARSDFYK